jgi:hypothetical protein
MGKARFGKDETVECIVDVPLKGPNGESLCVAHKTSTYWFIAGVYLTDDGHVLKITGEEAYLSMPTGTALGEFQAAGSLPAPLPGYEIPTQQYLLAYSLWIIMGALVLLNLLYAFGRRAVVALGWSAKPPDTGALSYGPPVLKTASDRFVFEQVSKLLLPGESVQHQAYALDRSTASGSLFAAATARGFFAALTSQRLLLIKTRVGAFAPLLENHGVEVIARDDIRDMSSEGDALTFHLHDGSVRALVVQNTRKLSNQRAFLRDVPRLVAPAPAQGFTLQLGQQA